MNWTEKAEQCVYSMTRAMTEWYCKKHDVHRLGMSILWVGWSKKVNAFTIPMRDDDGKICGIMLEDLEGKRARVGDLGVYCSPTIAGRRDRSTVTVVRGPVAAMQIVSHVPCWVIGQASPGYQRSIPRLVHDSPCAIGINPPDDLATLRCVAEDARRNIAPHSKQVRFFNEKTGDVYGDAGLKLAAFDGAAA